MVGCIELVIHNFNHHHQLGHHQDRDNRNNQEHSGIAFSKKQKLCKIYGLMETETPSIAVSNCNTCIAVWALARWIEDNGIGFYSLPYGEQRMIGMWNAIRLR